MVMVGILISIGRVTGSVCGRFNAQTYWHTVQRAPHHQRQRTSSSSSHSQINHRFWLKTFHVDEPPLATNVAHTHSKPPQGVPVHTLLKYVTDLFQQPAPPSSQTVPLTHIIPSTSPNEVTQGQEKKLSLPRSEMGMILIPKYGFMVPLHHGIVQSQHAVLSKDLLTSTAAAVTTPSSLLSEIVSTLQIEGSSSTVAAVATADKESKLRILVCGFSPRAAAHTTTSPSEEERPVHPERRDALNTALLRLTSGITAEELCSERYAGTPPARIYRSFVAPRHHAKLLIEPVERAATRTAQQIELALRQLRADEATRLSLLRNTDKALDLSNTPTRDAAAVAGQTQTHTEEAPKAPKRQHPLILIMDNIRSAHNVGSMFRTAETAALTEVITCGITAHPPNPKLLKTALSATEIVPSRHFDDVLQAIKQLKREGYHIVVMETTTNAKCYAETTYPIKTAIVVGNEITGVDQRVIAEADMTVEIPMYGIKNSLNVASAAPVVIFEILRQWKRDNVI